MDFFSRMSRPEPGEQPTDLAKVQADDALIESLRHSSLFEDAATTSFDPADFSDRSTSEAEAQLADLLKAWRQEIDSVPLPPPIDLALATAVVQSAPPRRRALRPMIAVAAAIAGLLVGSAAIGARSATPDTVLWPVTQLLWGDRADSVLAGIEASEGIESARLALDAGHPEAAATVIETLTTVITRVEQRDGREDLESDFREVKAELDSMTSSSPGSTVGSSTTTSPVAPGSSTSDTTSVTTSPDSSPAQTTDTGTPDPSSDPVTTPGTSEPLDTTTSEDPPTSSDDVTTDPITSDEVTDTTASTESTTDTTASTIGGGADGGTTETTITTTPNDVGVNTATTPTA